MCDKHVPCVTSGGYCKYIYISIAFCFFFLVQAPSSHERTVRIYEIYARETRGMVNKIKKIEHESKPFTDTCVAKK